MSPPPLSSPLGVIATNPMASTPSHLRLQPGPLSDSPHLSSQLPTCCLPRDLGLGMSQGGFLQAGLAPVFPTSGSGTNSTRKPRRRPRPLCFSRLPILAHVPHCALLCPFPCHLSSQVAVIPHLGYCCTVSTIHSLPQVRMVFFLKKKNTNHVISFIKTSSDVTLHLEHSPDSCLWSLPGTCLPSRSPSLRVSRCTVLQPSAPAAAPAASSSWPLLHHVALPPSS